ncbi:MAG: NAD(+)/NADH kinase [Methanoregulaceae archaeon]
MKISFVSRVDDPKALQYTCSLVHDLTSCGHETGLDPETVSVSRVCDVPVLDSGEANLVVVIGGDGTILRTVQRMKRQIPVVGINWGEVGFLADLEPDNGREFLTHLSGPIPFEPRMRLALFMEGMSLGECLNEAVIVTSRPAKMLRFAITVDSVIAERFRADGLIMSTPTGSTAYAMSAGGPIVDPRIEGFLLVPLAPYLLSSRPHLISSERKVEIRLESAKPAHLVLDGQENIDLGTACTLEVRRSSEPALFVDVGQNFFGKVEKKLRNL